LADWGIFLTVFIIALAIALALNPILDRLGRRWGIVSIPGGRRINEGDVRRVSKLGGVSLYRIPDFY
jgi:hypothetical protein